MFTGARLKEILRPRWDEVDLEIGILRLNDSKTDAKAIFLNEPAVEVLKALPRMLDNPNVIASYKEACGREGPSETLCMP